MEHKRLSPSRRATDIIFMFGRQKLNDDGSLDVIVEPIEVAGLPCCSSMCSLCFLFVTCGVMWRRPRPFTIS